MPWWMWLIIVVVVIAVAVVAFAIVQARRRAGGVISARDRSSRDRARGERS